MTLLSRLEDRLGNESRIQVADAPTTARAYLAAQWMARGRRPLLIGRSEADAEALYRDLSFFCGTTETEASGEGLLYLAVDPQSPFEEHSPQQEAVTERIQCLYRIAHEPRTVRAIVASPSVFTRKLVSPGYLRAWESYLLSGEDIDRDELIAHLVATGYNPVRTVEDPGTYSVRGGIIDIFSPRYRLPIRIDLFGDTVDSIRLFDPSNQRNREALEEAVVLPAREVAYSDEVVAHAKHEIRQLAETMPVPSRQVNALLEDVDNRLHFFGISALLPAFHPGGLATIDTYLAPLDCLAITPTLEELAPDFEAAHRELETTRHRALERHHLVVPLDAHATDADACFERSLSDKSAVLTPELELGADQGFSLGLAQLETLRYEVLRATRRESEYEHVLTPLAQRLHSWRADHASVVIACQSRGQLERVRGLLIAAGVQVRTPDAAFSVDRFLKTLEAANTARKEGRPHAAPYRDPSVHAWLILGEISGGLVIKEDHLVFISEEEIFGRRVQGARRKNRARGQRVENLQELEAGDYVVHIDYGIGLYKGLDKVEINGIDGDYLLIEYRGGDKLYIPVDRIKLVQKYMSASEGKHPPLDKLGAQTWANTKRKVKDTLLKMAAELLRLYAAREGRPGFALPAPDESFHQFEAEFPFETTPDQQTAIDDVLKDLQTPKPMDRLVCGDVGYGKTEVAMRATMLAAMANKQVAVLVPTTVLAAQHFNVFRERFKNFPVELAIVSRFQSAAEIKETLRKLKEGQVDIVIGTHRLLSKDVGFKELGLLIIDEEHRFGVAHKERLKKLRTEVHVLALSATPIPRTLHLGFMGVRDMSSIMTPPVDRLAVKTEVHKFSEEIIADAIRNELRRGGQCFVVHNRVSSIFAFAGMLSRLVPEARISVGHGKMDEKSLEKVMVDFMNRESNVLLSTTIIESGIDIPNANTIIVNRADRMGLAQLYQLRGRVGRSTVRGFAYFLIPAGTLTKTARQRISVLQRFTELGAGFKVASKDLEIRGAGNLLGKQQHGTIAQVGFDLYQTLLKEAIEEVKGQVDGGVRDPEVDLPVPALIPDSYVKPPGERLTLYQRFGRASDDDSTYDLLQELSDLYGPPPAEVENLTELMLVKQRLARLAASHLDFGGETKSMPPRVVIRFDEERTSLHPDHLVSFVKADPARRKLVPDGRLMIMLLPYEDPREILQQTKDALNALTLHQHREH